MLVQPRGDKAPDLIEDHRAGQEQPRNQGKL
jgi:hypothetical protein